MVPGRAPSPQTLRAGRRVIELRDRGVAWRSIPDTLTAEGFESATGAAWTPSKAQKVAKVVRLRAELESAAADPVS